MVTVSWTREIGEDVTFSVEDDGADEANEGNVTAKIALLQTGNLTLAAEAVAALTLTTSYRAAAGDLLEGWDFTATAAQTAALAPGRYQLDFEDATTGKVKFGPFYLEFRKAAV